MRTMLFLLAGLALLPRSAGSAEIRDENQKRKNVAIIGLDPGLDPTRSVTRVVPADAYRKTLSTAFASVQDSLLPTLEKHGDIQSSNAATWAVRTIAIGLGITGEVGLGPIFNITVSDRLRLVFTNSTQPVFPD